jgi:hypothetical protein
MFLIKKGGWGNQVFAKLEIRKTQGKNIINIIILINYMADKIKGIVSRDSVPVV